MNRCPGLSSGELHAAESAAVVCVKASLFSQETVSPTAVSNSAGEKANCSMLIVFNEGLTARGTLAPIAHADSATDKAASRRFISSR